MVLFDIDGTILWGGPLWKECFNGALQHYFPQLDFPAVPYGGKTDVQICRETMAAAGFSPEEVESNMILVIDEYVARASTETRTRAHEVQVLPGVREILEELSLQPRVLLGLLTGNVKKGADVKLAAVRLERYFKFGVYGDDDWDRYKLPAIAQARVKEQFGLHFKEKEIVIIGDTVHDVNCGKSIGARSIAVGTGRNIPREELLAQNPDYFFADLSSTFEVIQAILEELP